MLINPVSNVKIYLFTGYTDMRKGAASLAALVGSMLNTEQGSTASFSKLLTPNFADLACAHVSIYAAQARPEI